MRFDLLTICCLLLLAGVTHAAPQPLPQNMQLVGEAHLKVLWFDIYKAHLKNPKGEFESLDERQMLTLMYQRDISKQQLLDETREQWRKAGIGKQRYTVWLDKLDRIWPDIRKQDSLAFYRDEQGSGHFYFNNSHIGLLADSEFSRAFLAIWLADGSDFPTLTRALRGQ